MLIATEARILSERSNERIHAEINARKEAFYQRREAKYDFAVQGLENRLEEAIGRGVTEFVTVWDCECFTDNEIWTAEETSYSLQDRILRQFAEFGYKVSVSEEYDECSGKYYSINISW